MGYLYEESVAFEKGLHAAFGWYLKSAEQGIAEAQFKVASFYHDGIGVEKDDAKALEWYTLASNELAPALFNLATMYYLGEGTEVDKKKAFELYLRAAKQDDPDAQFRVGKMYFEGEGTEQNQEEGLIWFKVAASNGNKWAAEIIAKVNGRTAPE